MSTSSSSADFHCTNTVEDGNGTVVVEDTVGGMLDHAGRPAKRSTSGYWHSAYFIIGAGMAEKFAYYGVSSNIITYLTGPLGEPMAVAAANVNIWSGTGNFLPLLGGFVADSSVGRYRTIVVSSVVCILAFGLLSLSAMLNSESHNELQVCFFFSLYLVALGEGMHTPCLTAFGADQFDGQDAQERRGRSSFFNWVYFSACAGPLVAILVLNYIQDNISWVLGFGIPCISMAVSLAIFLFGTRSYRYTIKVEGNHPLWRIFRVFIKAARNWRTKSSTSSYDEEEQLEVVPRLCSQQFKFLNKALLAPDSSWEYDDSTNVSEVEDGKKLLRLIPIWVTSLGYAIVVAQTATLFTEQGLTMDRSIFRSIDIPAASLQCLIGFSSILLIPIYDFIFVPIARSITGNPLGITKLQRLGTGLVFCILTMVTAALVERKRVKSAQVYEFVGSPKPKVPMSFWWLVPQYILCGITNIFAWVGSQELFYDEVPCKLKSVSLSLCLTIFGIGEFLSSFLICIIHKFTSRAGGGGWFSSNPNEAHLDYFFWLLAGLNAVEFLAFLYFTKSYNYYGDQGIII